MYAKRQKAIIDAYLKQHKLESVLDVILNEIVETRPENPLKVISKLLDIKCLSEILRISLIPSLIENGGNAITCEIITNMSTYSSTYHASSMIDFSLYSEDFLSLNNSIYSNLQGKDPLDITNIANSITNLYIDNCLQNAILIALFRAYSDHQCQSLYKSVASYYHTEVYSKLPQLSIGILECTTPINNLSQTISLYIEYNNSGDHSSSTTDTSSEKGTNILAIFEVIRQIQIQLKSKLETEKAITILKNTHGYTSIQLPISKDEIIYPKEDKKAAAAAAKSADKGKKGSTVAAVVVPTEPVITPAPTITSSPSMIKYWLQIIQELLSGELSKKNELSTKYSIKIGLDMKNLKNTYISSGFKTEAEMTIYINDLLQSCPLLNYIHNIIQIEKVYELPSFLLTLQETWKKDNKSITIGSYIQSLNELQLLQSNTEIDSVSMVQSSEGEPPVQIQANDNDHNADNDDENKKKLESVVDIDSTVTENNNNNNNNGNNNNNMTDNQTAEVCAEQKNFHIKIDFYEINSIPTCIDYIKRIKKLGYTVILCNTPYSYIPNTTDTFIVDFAVALGVDFLEYGGLLSSENFMMYMRYITIMKEYHTLYTSIPSPAVVTTTTTTTATNGSGGTN